MLSTSLLRCYDMKWNGMDWNEMKGYRIRITILSYHIGINILFNHQPTNQPSTNQPTTIYNLFPFILPPSCHPAIHLNGSPDSNNFKSRDNFHLPG